MLLAMGFVHPVQADTNNYQTSIDKVFAAGDMRRGQSLVFVKGGKRLRLWMNI
jgi:glutamate synthase (NADPH/NADH) small chain